MFMFFSFFLFLCSVKNHKKNHANKTLKECKVNPDNAKYIYPVVLGLAAATLLNLSWLTPTVCPRSSDPFYIVTI